ncbi:hypothetical protein DFH09DRAFT_1099209 [Mycena vulgaris]|nr:hypothetical protein DFH09DRAFT_1099209 [Mycena vulgaris]
MPIVIKCTSGAEANTALGLQPVFKKLGCETADEHPREFASALMASNQISDIFATTGSFYAVYKGKTERAIYVRNFSDVEKQIHNNHWAKHHRFETLKEALVYMVFKGDLTQVDNLRSTYPKIGAIRIP